MFYFYTCTVHDHFGIDNSAELVKDADPNTINWAKLDCNDSVWLVPGTYTN